MDGFTIEATLLVKLLELGKRIVRRGEKPILEHALFRTGKLYITNEETVIVGNLHFRSGHPAFTLPVKELLGLLKAQKAPTASFSFHEEGKVMVNGVTLQSGNVEDYPDVEVKKGTKVFLAKADIPKLVEVSKACSSDINKKILNGVLLKPDFPLLGGPVAVATDGHRLNISKFMYSGPEVVVDQRMVDLIARAFIGKRPKFDFNGDFRVSREWFTAVSKDVMISSKLLKGSFPNPARVIPETGTMPTRVQLPDDFTDQIQPGISLATDRYHALSFEVNGKIEVGMKNPGVGEWKAELHGCEKTGRDANVSINAKYLVGAIKAAGKQGVTMHLHPEPDDKVKSPILFTDFNGDLKALVMPMMN